jgi:hypothetical protein
MIRQLEMSSLRALEREAILAAPGSCYVTLARWISAPVTVINCATSPGVSAVKLASTFGVRLAVFARVKPSNENFVFRRIASFQ